jgi:signal transduction histidine kinase
MKSKFYLAFILAGIVPVLGLAGFYIYTTLAEPSATSSVSAPAAVAVNPAQQQGEVQTIASSLFNAIKSTNADATNLAAHHAPADVDTFLHSHNGVSGVVLLDPTGKAVRTMPDNPPLVDANYGSSAEFLKIQDKFKNNNGSSYEFYTNRFGYPAFVFAVPLASGYSGEVVLNVTQFFKGASLNGQYFIVDASSGQFLYSSDPSKMSAGFNPQHEAWLNQVTTDLMSQKNGVATGPSMGAAYGYLGFGKFGVVHVFPLTVPGAATSAKAVVKNDISETVQTPMVLGFLLALAFLFIGAAIASRLLATPFRRAVGVILAAADDPATLTPEVVKSFGSDEAGQRQSRQYQTETQEKAQQLGDKLKELDALKGMSEGLRNQSEQAKNEISRLKGELSSAQAVQVEFTALQGKFAQLQTQLKAAETKAVQAAASASSVQVSQVRAAAIRTMSEELKNTLGIIKGYVSSVIGAGQGGINEKQQEFLGMVINRSARLEKFINDLVDMYQVEIEQKDAKIEEVDLPREIETLAFNFQTQTELKNLKFKVDAKPGLPKVPVVRRRLTQLWNVLYLQLIKDAPKGTTIPIVVESAGDMIKVTLHDPGLTVTAEGLPKLFDEFYDPKHPSSPQLAGTGLKMSLVKTILNTQGGSARAEKAEPGTRIILTFATKRPGDATASPAMTMPPMTAPALTPKPATPGASAAKPGLDLDSAFGVKPTTAPGITVGAKPLVAPGTPAATPMAPPSGISTGSKIPGMEGPSGPTAPLPPIAGLTVGAKPPSTSPVAPGNALDALISGKIPSVTAPGVKPPMPAAPAPATTAPAASVPAAPPTVKPPMPPVPGAPPVAKAPIPPVPGASTPTTPAPAVPKAPVPPIPAPGAPKPPEISLDSLLNQPKAPPAPGAPPVIKPTAPPGAPKSPSDGDLLE